jgi:hypothetical protein
MAAPCGVLYHHGCQRVGLPFHTSLREQAGQAFPSMEYVPNYICEACTGRAVLGRELGENDEDVSILLLERMCMIDIANRWAKGTISRYTYAIRRIRKFEKQFNVSILRTTKLVAPPVSPAIPLQWAHQHYTLHTTKSGKNKGIGYPRTVPGSCAVQHPTLLTSTSKSPALAKFSKTTDAQSWLST